MADPMTPDPLNPDPLAALIHEAMTEIGIDGEQEEGNAWCSEIAAYLRDRGVRVSEDAHSLADALNTHHQPDTTCPICRYAQDHLRPVSEVGDETTNTKADVRFRFVALRSEDAAPQPDRPSATWRPADRTVLAAMAPIVDGLCSGCGTKPSRETGSCRCLFRIDDVIRGADR